MHNTLYHDMHNNYLNINPNNNAPITVYIVERGGLCNMYLLRGRVNLIEFCKEFFDFVGYFIVH